MVLFNQSPRAKAMTAKVKKKKKSILLENTFLPFGVEMLFSWFMIVLFTMYLHLQTEISLCPYLKHGHCNSLPYKYDFGCSILFRLLDGK